MPKKGANISLSSYDDIFSTQESRPRRADRKPESMWSCCLWKRYIPLRTIRSGL